MVRFILVFKLNKTKTLLSGLKILLMPYKNKLNGQKVTKTDQTVTFYCRTASILEINHVKKVST